MSDKLIEAVAKAICQSAMDENEVARNTPMEPLTFSRNTAGDASLWAIFETDAAAALFAIEASGYRVVPKEPTEAMSKADFSHAFKTPDDMPADDNWRPDVVYAAMLAAAPKVTP